MINKYNIGNYYLKDSLIHKLNPILKIICLFIMIISVVISNSFIDFSIILIYLVIIMLLSKIDIKIYLKNIYTLRVFIIFIIIINLIFGVGIVNTIFMILRIIYLVLISAILTLTTAPMEITYGLERVLSIFNKILPINDIALTITLALRFIPILTMQAERIIKAQGLRGVDFDKNLKTKIISLSNIFIPMIYLSLKKADELSDIMEVRLYNYGISRTNYRLNKWKYVDTFLLSINIIILILCLWR